ncbi:NAD-dependent epimerase/dehydratase family protein [Agaribacter flavus]|uniref:NAD-dependent epimerase/dehydratase family protein n=1 Tax=Agaribacter flavus TaxID=1902781 RepID=A0ABV7FLQ1_9ALTE
MRVTIIGLGWLGHSLALRLSQQGADIVGTVRQTEKQKHLNSNGICTHLFDCYQRIDKATANALFSQRHIVINIAAGRRNIEPKRYFDAIKSLIDTAKTEGCNKILFVSTSSVFAEGAGVVTNDTPTSPETASGQVHADIETYLLSSYSQATVLRLAGLVGPNPEVGYRHPIYSLSKRKSLANPHAPVNLVHKADVIAAIQSILMNNFDRQVFNLCSQIHPSRQEYYSWCALKLGLPLLNFETKTTAQSTTQLTKTKTIEVKGTLKALGIALQYPSPFDMLP